MQLKKKRTISQNNVTIKSIRKNQQKEIFSIYSFHIEREYDNEKKEREIRETRPKRPYLFLFFYNAHKVNFSACTCL